MAITSTIAKLIVEVGADISGLRKGLSTAEKAVSDVGSGLKSTGAALTRNVTLPVVAAGAAVTKLAVDWESAFAGVRKTVDGTEGELRALEKALLETAATTPVSPETLAHIAELGGQLGIARDELVDFSTTIAALAESTNLTAEEGATALAQFVNITKPVAREGMQASEQIARLGSVIVALGNNMATTEADIVSFAQRVAGAGATVGMSQEDIIAWSAALSSVGIEAEAGGTAISRVMLEMNTAVAGSTEELETFAAVAGMSAEAFTEAWKRDPSEAMLAFVQGLAKMRDEGENVIPVLEDLGLNEIRVRDALLRSSGAADLLAQSLQIARGEFEANNALTEEAGKRYETTASQMRILLNNLKILGIEVGRVLLPALNDLLKAVIPVVRSFANWAREHPNLVKIGIALAGVAAVVGPILALVGAMASGVSAITGFVGALSGIAGLSGVVSGAASAIAAAIAAIGWPITAVIAAVGGLALAWRNNWFDIQGKTAAVVDWIREKLAIFSQLLQVDWRTLLTNMVEVASERWPQVGAIWESGQEFIHRASQAWQALMEGNWYSFGFRLQQTAKAFLEIIKNLFSLYVDMWKEILSTGWNKMLETTKAAASNIINAFKNVDWGAVGRSIIDGITSGVKSAVGGLVDAARSAARAAIDAARGFLDAHSPSRLAARAVGMPIAEGMAVGILEGIRVVENAMRTLAGSAIPAPALPQIPQVQTPAPAHAAAAPNGVKGYAPTIVNIYNPKGEVSEESLKRTARRLATLGVL